MRRILLAGSSALALSMVIDTTAEANDRSVRAVTIPAAACQPIADSRAELTGVGWIARDDSVTLLVCPVPFNNIELGTTSTDNDVTSFRVYYIDSDGAGNANNVLVAFYRYDDKSIASSTLCQATLAPATTLFTSSTVPCVEDVASGGTYYGFLVQLTAATGGQVLFRGIDFP